MAFSLASLTYLGGIRTPHDRSTDVTYLPNAYPTDGKSKDGTNFGGRPFAFDRDRREFVMGSKYGRVIRLQVVEPLVHTQDDVNTFPVAPYVTPAMVDVSGHSAQPNPPTTNKSWFEMSDPWDASNNSFGGVMPLVDRILAAGTSYYDANNQQRRSVLVADWPAASPANEYLPHRTPFKPVGNPTSQGLVAGYFASIPEPWQERLKGNMLMGQASLPIISRGSAGPCATSFRVEDVRDLDTVASTLLVGYPNGHWMPEHPWDGTQPDEVYGAATQITGMAILGDTLVFVGSHGYGAPCYGNGTKDPDLAGQPSGDGTHYCYDPTNSSKGNHAYPYRLQIWHYPLDELADVAAGIKEPWDLRPEWFALDVPFHQSAYRCNGCAYDPESQRFYISMYAADKYGYEPGPVFYAYQFTDDVEPPDPLPPDDGDELKKAVVALTAALAAERQRHDETKATLADREQRLAEIAPHAAAITALADLS